MKSIKNNLTFKRKWLRGLDLMIIPSSFLRSAIELVNNPEDREEILAQRNEGRNVLAGYIFKPFMYGIGLVGEAARLVLYYKIFN